MCDLCIDGSKEKAAAVSSHFAFAERLRELAGDYEALASGSLYPHGALSKSVGASAHIVIRRLAEDWL